MGIVAALVLLLAADTLLYPWLGVRPRPGPAQAQDGLWLRYPWYFGRHSEAETREMARRLRREGIRYAYFHVRHVTAEGRLRYRFPEEARRLVRLLREEAPEVVPVAWVFAGNNGMGGLPVVRLERPQVRREMAREGAWLVRECGFRGVQWDYEICPDGDPSYPLLLRETRAELDRLPGERPLLGACTAVWSPEPFRRLAGWGEGYFSRMAAECDQLAVMGYDTGLYLPRAYARLMREQVARVPRAALRGNPNCRVVIGVPTYGRGGASHQAWSENLRVALQGVRDGLADRRFQPAGFSGVALFADYTTQPEEWREYRHGWRGFQR